MISILPFISAAVLSFLSTPLVILLYKKKRWMDDPIAHPHPKVIHTLPLPRGGGIPIFIAVSICVFTFVSVSPQIGAIVVGTFILMALGVIDDVYDPHPVVRLIAQVLVSLLVVSQGIAIWYVTNPLGGIVDFRSLPLALEGFPFLPHLLAVFWIVWCMNIVNFSKGLDGQMPGYVVVSAVVIALLSLRFDGDPSQLVVLKLALITGGAYLGFLFWNMYPQKIMPGFGGSTIAGFLLAVLSIMSGAKLATAILVLSVPMVDAFIVILRRLLRKQSPFWGDRTHLHHLLMDLGWGRRRIAAFYWISAAVMGTIALQLKSEHKIFTIVGVCCILLGILLWLRSFSTFSARSDQDNG